MKQPTVSQFKVTDEQKAWLDAESERTCDAVATIVRRLIQLQVDKSKKAKKEG